jgi:hypothetical protein
VWRTNLTRSLGRKSLQSPLREILVVNNTLEAILCHIGPNRRSSGFFFSENSKTLRVNQDHRPGARARQRFGHPHPADRAEEPGLRFLLKSRRTLCDGLAIVTSTRD